MKRIINEDGNVVEQFPYYSLGESKRQGDMSDKSLIKLTELLDECKNLINSGHTHVMVDSGFAKLTFAPETHRKPNPHEIRQHKEWEDLEQQKEKLKSEQMELEKRLATIKYELSKKV